ncbi:EAL domain-containing protein [Bacillus sp. A301a_S52]|nr:EAL domain-containing protein [Bacillus sp. A301a_S52]
MMRLKQHRNRKALTNTSIYKSHDDYSIFYDLNPEAAFILKSEGVFISLNKAAEKLLGRTQEDLIGTSLYHFIDSSIVNNTIDSVNTVMLSQGSRSISTIITTPQNKCIHVILYVTTYINGQGIQTLACIAKNSEGIEQYNSKLLKIKNNLNELQEIVKGGIWNYNSHTKELDWSKQVSKILGIQKQSASINEIEQYQYLFKEQDLKRLKSSIKNLCFQGRTLDVSCPIKRHDGSMAYIRIHGKPTIKKDDQNSLCLTGVIQDTTAYHSIKKELIEKNIQAENLYNQIEEIVWSLDMTTNKVIFCSNDFEEITGWKLSDLIGPNKLWKETIHPKDKDHVTAAINRLLDGKQTSFHYQFYHASGQLRWGHFKAYPILDSHNQLIRLDGIIQDITCRKEMENKLLHIAYHDHITGLPNRLHFEETLQKKITLAQQTNDTFAIFHIDLDRFRHINEMLGYEIGNDLLQHTAIRLKEHSDCDYYISRISGNEFAVILSNCELAEAKQQAAKYLESLRPVFKIKDYELYITGSIGIALFPNHGKDLEHLLKNSETALYHAKNDGKNTFKVYYSTMTTESKQRYSLEKDLRNALQTNQLFIEYQPKVSPENHLLTGGEALLRWKHPKLGRVSPAEFIPLAEESDLICHIGDWVIENVCQQMQKWEAEGLPLIPISINISALHLTKVDLITKVKQALTNYHIPPHLFEIEITETSLIQSSELIFSRLEALKQLGVRISLDDFGVGYSSLTHLLRFHLDALKIDKSLIANLPHKREDSIIISTLIKMAKGLGISLVAEGVETTAQLDFLKQEECHFVQGYLFSQPVSPLNFSRLVKKGILPIQAH